MCFFFPLLPTFLIIIILTLIVTKKGLNRPKHHGANLPPSPWKLPLLGNIHHLIGAGQLHRTLRDLSQQHGPIMHLKLGQIDHVVFSSPETAREILKSHDLNFASRPQFAVSGGILPGNRAISFAPYGVYWRQLRKICVLELLSTRRVKSFRNIREGENAALVASIISTAGSLVNLTEKLTLLTNTITALALFGSKSKHGPRFISEIKKLVPGLSIADLYPSLGFLDTLLGTTRKIESIQWRMNEILDEIITDHQVAAKKPIQDGKEEEEDDLLDVLLMLKDQGGLDFPLSINDIKVVTQDLFFAGSETSTTTVIWAMAELMRHPEVMEKVQGEVRNAAKVKGAVDEDNIVELQYMKLVIKETLRLHPPLPLLLPRVCRETCSVGGFVIPGGSRVIVNGWAIGRDPKYWEDAESFRPERFEGMSVDYFRGESFHYLPFGGGRRICPGINFGLANVELTLAQLLLHFDWELPDGMEPGEVDMTESFGTAVCRKEDLCLIATPRFPLPANVAPPC